MSISVRFAAVNQSRAPGVSGIRWRMPGSLNTVNHSSVMAGRSSIVASSTTRGVGVDMLGVLFVGCCRGVVLGNTVGSTPGLAVKAKLI